MVLLQQSSIPKLAPGGVGCFRSRHSLVNESLREQFDVRLNFIAELAVRYALAGQPVVIAVNNKAEGSAPLTCFKIAQYLAAGMPLA